MMSQCLSALVAGEFFVADTKEEGAALEVSTEVADVVGGVADEPGERFAAFAVGCCGAELAVGGRKIVAELLIPCAQLGDLLVASSRLRRSDSSLARPRCARPRPASASTCSPPASGPAGQASSCAPITSPKPRKHRARSRRVPGRPPR
jgi:hypothetical protein